MLFVLVSCSGGSDKPDPTQDVLDDRVPADYYEGPELLDFTVTPNPDLVRACGLNVILVLDESGSIQSTSGAETAVRNAATSFVSALADTGSEMAIIEFGTEAKKVFDYTAVTSGVGGTIDTVFNPYINATATSGDVYDAPSQLGGWTNWDDALDEVENINANSGVAPLLIFVTDGDPTAYNRDLPGEDNGVTTDAGSDPQSLERAVAEANAVKDQGTHILVVGIGNGLNNATSQQRLRDISGNDEFTGSPDVLDIETDDVARVTDFMDLEAALRQVAFDLCAPSLTITKLADDNGDGTFEPAQGWEFNAGVEAPIPDGTDYTWILPNGATPGGQASVTTGSEGTATFQWEPNSLINSQITFDETAQPDYEFVDASCIRKTLTENGVTETQFTLDTLPATVEFSPTDIVTCEVKNQFISNPSLTITKTADPATYDAVGDIINYTIVATNNGNTTLFGVTVSDPGVDGLSCTPSNGSSLAPTEIMTCSATYTITQADLDAGSYLNTACVDDSDGEDGDGPADEACANETVTGNDNPAIDIVKTADVATYDSVGDVITYTFAVDNVGNVTLAPVVVTDPLAGLTAIDCGDGTNSIASLAPSDPVVECTATYTITQADIDNGSVDNTATATGTPPEGPDVTDTDDETVNAGQNPGLSITKTADPATYDAVGDIINYTIVATNNGNTTLFGVTVSDPGVDGLSCTPSNGSSLAPTEIMTCSATYTITQADLDAGSYLNTACVDDSDGEDGDGPADEACANETVTGNDNPAIDIVKTADVATYDSVGDVITYTFAVDNVGNVTLAPVVVTDPLAGLTAIDCGDGTNSIASLAPSDPVVECTATYTITQADIDNGSVDNTATATGTPPEGPDVTDTDDETVNAGQNPGLSITKTADPATYDAVGDIINYTIVATNNGNTTLFGVTVSDPGVDGLSCTPSNGSSLAPTEIMTCSATYTITQADLDAGSYLNTACVDDSDGEDGDGPADEACANETVTGNDNPAIDIVKTADVATYDSVGDVITYTFAVDNVGNVTLAPVVVTDPLAGLTAIDCGDGTNSIASLAPSDPVVECTATYTITQADIDNGSVDNTATATGTPPEGPDVTDTDDETVNADQNPELSITKTADPQTYSAVGQIINYTIVATNTGNTTLNGVVVTDPKVDNLSCVPANDGTASLAPTEKMECTASHTITQADIDNKRYDNTACVDDDDDSINGAAEACADETVTVDPIVPSPALSIIKEATGIDEAGDGKLNAVGDIIEYTITATNIGGFTLTNVQVSDPLLGTLTCNPPQPANLPPGEEIVCTGSYAITQDDLDGNGNAGPDLDIDNTATATSEQTDPVNDSEEVPLEPPPPAGGEGCTPGYWKQPHHFDSWVGYSPDDSFAAIFGVPYDKTLLQALKTGGGKQKALGRHAVAALLNSTNGDVSYAFTTSQVIDMVQLAYATGDYNRIKNILESENQQGCPLN